MNTSQEERHPLTPSMAARTTSGILRQSDVNTIVEHAIGNVPMSDLPVGSRGRIGSGDEETIASGIGCARQTIPKVQEPVNEQPQRSSYGVSEADETVENENPKRKQMEETEHEVDSARKKRRRIITTRTQDVTAEKSTMDENEDSDDDNSGADYGHIALLPQEVKSAFVYRLHFLSYTLPAKFESDTIY